AVHAGQGRERHDIHSRPASPRPLTSQLRPAYHHQAAGAELAATGTNAQRAALVRAPPVGGVQFVADDEHRIAPPSMLERPLCPALELLQRHQDGVAHVHPSSMLPSRSAVAVTTSPARTGTAAVKPPDSTMSPARSPSFSAASEPTSQATAAAGWPSAAAPAAVATTSPLCSSTTPISRRSRPAAGTAEPTR